MKKTLLLLLIIGLTLTVSSQVLEKGRVVAGAERAFDKTAKAIAMPAPGCAVGVSLNGEPVFERAFGLAEMEHNIANTPLTIFESGSVAKQFTAAALVLLQQDGKLDLDDPVRKYIPELPEYGATLTIRHMLNHTAGLRDWGAVMSLTGAGRGDRVIGQDLAFDVMTSQKGLDFTPGAEYSYSNSGYNLAAVIIERVSQKKFPDFVAERLFKPLGMTNSTWRDDYQRIVPGRALAYSRQGAKAPWRLDMPFMNVYGNGGMLTTVGDWLKWNAMLDTRSLGASFVDELETQGVLNDGRKIPYALGLRVSKYRDLPEVAHGGSTAGYQTFLVRYPKAKVSVAVMCNGTAPSATSIARSVTDEIFGPFPPPVQPESFNVPVDQLKKFVGLWRDERTHTETRTTIDGGTLRVDGQPLRPVADGVFAIGAAKLTFKIGSNGKPSYIEADQEGDVSRFILETEWKPTAAELAEFSGQWYSEEAQAGISFVVEGDKAHIFQRPKTNLPLTPLYKNHFSAGDRVIWFTRNTKGKIDKMHVGASRMRDMPFERVRK